MGGGRGTLMPTSTGVGGKQAVIQSAITIANIAPNFFILLLPFKRLNEPLHIVNAKKWVVTSLSFDVLIKLSIHDSFHFQEFKHDESP